MKKLLIIALIFITIGGIILGVAFIMGLSKDMLAAQKSEIFNYEPASQTFSQPFTNIEIELTIQRLELHLETRTDVKVDYFTSNEYEISTIVESNTFKFISRNQKWVYSSLFSIFNLFDYQENVVKVYVPNIPYNEIKISVMNSSLSFNNLESQKLNVKVTNGNLSLTNGKVTECFLSTTNGSIKVDNFMGLLLNCETTNGQIEGKSITTSDSIKFKTTNDRVTLSNSESTNIEVKSTNGNIEVKGTVFTKLDAKTTNGKISLSTSFSINDYKQSFSTTNGSIYINSVWHGTKHANSKPDTKSIILKTTNGPIYVTSIE